jgi:MYXO-CTERM domain-containing protein
MKNLLMLSLLLSAPVALATAPQAGYVQVQSTETGTSPAAATGAAVDNAAAATGQAAQDVQNGVNNTVDPNKDGVVDSNNDGVADTRQFPWGLFGLFGLFGLLGARRREEHRVVTHGTGTTGVNTTATVSPTDRR